MRLAVAIATVGRADLLRRTLRHTLHQSRPPDRMLIVGASEADVAGLAQVYPAAEILLTGRGLPRQRNAALDALAGDCDAVVFFDDDFVPSTRFLAQTEALLSAHPDIVVLTGRLLDDGINKAGISLEDAAARVRAHDEAPQQPNSFLSTTHAYGCNMVLRISAAKHLRFDERLPLYAWQEDRDISARFARYGRVTRATVLTGVHMGAKSGRQSGLRLGYSQIANPLYLVRKKTMPAHRAIALAGKNLLANTVRSLAPEPWVDRPGRLRGNLLALWDALRGRADPERILSL